ncbi:MAG: ABC transporter permease, partial [Thiohalomonadales bacterium]
MSWQQVLVSELQAVFADRALLLTIFGGVIFYSFFYPVPYSTQLPRNQAVVVVDFDRSSLSRKLIRMVDATPEVQIQRYADTVSEAQQAIVEKGLAGMLVIPKNF